MVNRDRTSLGLLRLPCLHCSHIGAIRCVPSKARCTGRRRGLTGEQVAEARDRLKAGEEPSAIVRDLVFGRSKNTAPIVGVDQLAPISDPEKPPEEHVAGLGVPHKAVMSPHLLRYLYVPHRQEPGLGFVLREPEVNGSLTKSRVRRSSNATASDANYGKSRYWRAGPRPLPCRGPSDPSK